MEITVPENYYSDLLQCCHKLIMLINIIKNINEKNDNNNQDKNDKPKLEPKKRGRKPKTISIVDDSGEEPLTVEV